MIATSLFLCLSLLAARRIQAADPPPSDNSVVEDRLVGTLEGSPDVTFAVFENPATKKQKSYRVGDFIDGAQIIEIKKQRVLLKTGDRISAISISGGSPVDAGPLKPAPSANEKTPQTEIGRILSRQTPPYELTLPKTTVSAETVAQLSGQLQRYTGSSPAFAETAVGKGVRVSDLGQDAAGNLGLKGSDIIVGISGMGIESPQQISQIIEILNRAKVFNLSVTDGSTVQSLSYQRGGNP
jgi:general secretion pathway protein C